MVAVSGGLLWDGFLVFLSLLGLLSLVINIATNWHAVRILEVLLWALIFLLSTLPVACLYFGVRSSGYNPQKIKFWTKVRIALLVIGGILSFINTIVSYFTTDKASEENEVGKWDPEVDDEARDVWTIVTLIVTIGVFICCCALCASIQAFIAW